MLKIGVKYHRSCLFPNNFS